MTYYFFTEQTKHYKHQDAAKFLKMKRTSNKRPLTRAEKLLFFTPLLVLILALYMTAGRQVLRRSMGWPVRVIQVPGKGRSTDDKLRLFTLSDNGKIAVNRGQASPLHIYDVRNGDHLYELPIFRRQVSKSWFDDPSYGCYFLPGGQQIVASFRSKPSEIWDIGSASRIGQLGMRAHKAAVSLNGNSICTTGYEIWDLKWNQLKHKLLNERTDRTPKFSFDGKLVALRGPFDYDAKKKHFSGGQVLIWDVGSGILRIKLPTLMADEYSFSPDGKQLVCVEPIYGDSLGVRGNNLKLFDLSSGHDLWKYTSQTTAKGWMDVTFSPNGKWIAASTSNDFIELRNPQTGELKATLRSGWRDQDIDNTFYSPPNLGFTRDGKWLVLRARHEIRIWDMDEVNARFSP